MPVGFPFLKPLPSILVLFLTTTFESSMSTPAATLPALPISPVTPLRFGLGPEIGKLGLSCWHCLISRADWPFTLLTLQTC